MAEINTPLTEDRESDKKEYEKYQAYRKAYDILNRDHPECVVIGENKDGKTFYYGRPFAVTMKDLNNSNRWFRAKGENRVYLALYPSQLSNLKSFVEKGIMIPAQFGLGESVKGKASSEDIDNFIDELYELRKTSIATEGEYGMGNLIFKEMRNRGYLDNLKELKRERRSQELSLEHLED